MAALTVKKHRTNAVILDLPYDVSDDTLVSEIRESVDPDSTLIATWTIAFLTDGVDGKVVLTLDNSVTTLITQDCGYMDVKRVSSGEPLDCFKNPIKVLFRNTVTA